MATSNAHVPARAGLFLVVNPRHAGAANQHFHLRQQVYCNLSIGRTCAPIHEEAEDTNVRDIDYRCLDCRFPVFASCVTISNPDSLSSSETRVYPGIRSWKKHLSDWARRQKAVGGVYFTKKWRAETLQPGSEFDNFKPWLKSGNFKYISWLNGLFFGRGWSRFSERESQDLSNGINVAS